MSAFPNPNFRGATATISLKADSLDYEHLRDGSKAAGLGQSHMLHLLLESMRLRVLSERFSGNLPVDNFGSDLEAFVWLVAQDSGLISAEELQAGAWAVKHTSGGSTFKERQEGLFELLQRRWLERRGEWPNELELFNVAPSEPVDDDHPARTAEEIKRLGNKAHTDAGATE